MKSVGAAAFEGCDSLKSISLPEVREIGGMAFSHCTSLSSISLPYAGKIGSYAFLYCNKVTSIYLPHAIEIGKEVFDDCNALTELTIATQNVIQTIGSQRLDVSGVNLTIGKISQWVIREGNTLTTTEGWGWGPFKSITMQEYIP